MRMSIESAKLGQPNDYFEKLFKHCEERMCSCCLGDGGIFWYWKWHAYDYEVKLEEGKNEDDFQNLSRIIFGA